MERIAEKIGNVIDKTEAAISQKIGSKHEVLTVVKEAQDRLLEIKQSIILAEANGTRMQRNWRPALMFLFGGIIGYSTVVAPILFHFYGIPKPELTPEFWDVLQLAIGGYVIGRSAEKALPPITQAARGLLRRKKL